VLTQLASATSWEVIREVTSHFGHVFLVMGLGYVIHLLPSAWKSRYRVAFATAPFGVQIVTAVAAVGVAMAVLSAGGTPFIYFQF
jgi:hypothetical protein